MNKPYGVSGALAGLPHPDHCETFAHGDFTIAIDHETMAIGSDSPIDPEEARKLGELYASVQSLRYGLRISANLNHSWRPGDVPGSTSATVNIISIPMAVKLGPVRATVSRGGKTLQDTASFTNETEMVQKALRDATLADALHYFTAEALDEDRPLYGIYKALEAIVHQLESAGAKDGRAALARLAGESTKYVSDVMETAQTQRHARTTAKRKLSDQECRTRAAHLIKTYSDSL